ncbi:MAG: glucosamine-6-phosphate deaminase [Bacillota bacterium]|jgi:glucosamine-6-phosphate deaminase|nr:glucosamine-6-phosphate deaminase [Bacillota bacterium]HHT91683.1 glucosamine-6-phosphate deaminase [Bacillota bacterium]
MLRPVRSFQMDKLMVEVYPDRPTMGQSAADAAVAKLRRLLEDQESINVVFAAAPSQNEFLEALVKSDGVEWQRVRAFHLDEYLGLCPGSAQRFGAFLDEHVFQLVELLKVHYLRGDAEDPQAEALRYAELLRKHPLDLAFIGIGENGHIAFNDPPVADFADPDWVKVVTLDEKCRRQQVHDGCFPSFGAVPTQALTLTIPAIMSAKAIYCMVPGVTKREAVRDTLQGSIGTHCPATILRRHDAATLYLDGDSASLL